MTPKKIHNSYLSLNVTKEGEILKINSGNFLKDNFTTQNSIFTYCSFLEKTLLGLHEMRQEDINGMLITIDDKEFNVNIGLIQQEEEIEVIIQDQTEIYKYITELNQDRNEFFLMKTRLAKQNKELEIQKQIADKANEEKSRFLAVMSHEIRNPLNSILGYAEIIASEASNSGINNYAKTLQVSSKNLLVIVNDILDLSRLEANKLELLEEVFSLKEILEVCIDDFKIRYKNAQVSLVLNLGESLPEFLIGDSVRLTQIISNLINNAFKFTKKGSITLSVGLNKSNPEKETIEFKIVDTGRGMHPEKIHTIFKEYEQTEVSDYRVNAGAGLGLSIVKRLVDTMKGEINVESELNVGSTFIINIPYKIVEPENSVKETIKEESYFDFSNIKVLYADDDILNQSIAKHLLEETGIKLYSANDGVEAIEEIKKQKFDVILLDIFMPNITGEDIIINKEIFSSYNKATPSIAITANTSTEEIDRYLSLGFADVVAKPYKGKDLLSAIEKALR